MLETGSYARALFDYCVSHSEEALYQASLISAQFIQDGVGPDEIVALHFEAVQEVTGDPSFSPTERVRVLNDAHQFLLEVMIGYGAQYKQFLELKLAAVTQRADTAERSEREKLELFAMIAHELGNPLTVALGNMHIAVRFLDAQDMENLRVLVSESREALERLAHLTRQIITASRGDVTPLHVEPLDLVAILKQAGTWANRAAESKGVELKIEPADHSLLVSGDQDALTSLVDNLLSNAIRYTPPSGKVTIRCGSSEGNGWLEVHDSGIGMTDEERESIFTKFYRGTRAKQMASGGLGMGLHIVQHVAALHGGAIEVESETDKGSTFRFTMPLLQEGTEE
jgi:signal transduction histidine kinase